MGRVDPDGLDDDDGLKLGPTTSMGGGAAGISGLNPVPGRTAGMTKAVTNAGLFVLITGLTDGIGKAIERLVAGCRMAKAATGFAGAPPGKLPLGWNKDWELLYGTRQKGGSAHWFDPKGGEWRWHAPDSWHSTGHWDYNPWDSWNSKWQNIY